MAILKVARLGHPVLRQVAEPVAAKDIETLQGFIDDLIETMQEMDGVGLAAPQVHVSKRVLVYQTEESSTLKRSPRMKLHVLVNPVITPQTKETEMDWEGCLSLPDLRGEVSRVTSVRVEALDRKGGPLDYIATGFHARVVQHETDHLDGIVYLDRMKDLSSLSFLEEFYRYGDD